MNVAALNDLGLDWDEIKTLVSTGEVIIGGGAAHAFVLQLVP